MAQLTEAALSGLESTSSVIPSDSGACSAGSEVVLALVSNSESMKSFANCVSSLVSVDLPSDKKLDAILGFFKTFQVGAQQVGVTGVVQPSDSSVSAIDHENTPLVVKSRSSSRKRKRNRKRKTVSSLGSHGESVDTSGSSSVVSYSPAQSDVASDAYGYTVMFPGQDQQRYAVHYGEWPQFGELLSSPASWFESVSFLEQLGVQRVSQGVYVIAAGGPSLALTLCMMVNTIGVESFPHHSLAREVQHYSTDRKYAHKAPLLVHTLGGTCRGLQRPDPPGWCYQYLFQSNHRLSVKQTLGRWPRLSAVMACDRSWFEDRFQLVLIGECEYHVEVASSDPVKNMGWDDLCRLPQDSVIGGSSSKPKSVEGFEGKLTGADMEMLAKFDTYACDNPATSCFRILSAEFRTRAMKQLRLWPSLRDVLGLPAGWLMPPDSWSRLWLVHRPSGGFLLTTVGLDCAVSFKEGLQGELVKYVESSATLGYKFEHYFFRSYLREWLAMLAGVVDDGVFGRFEQLLSCSAAMHNADSKRKLKVLEALGDAALTAAVATKCSFEDRTAQEYQEARSSVTSNAYLSQVFGREVPSGFVSFPAGIAPTRGNVGAYFIEAVLGVIYRVVGSSGVWRACLKLGIFDGFSWSGDSSSISFDGSVAGTVDQMRSVTLRD